MFQVLSALFGRWRAMRGARAIDQRYSADYEQMFQEQIWLALESADRGDPNQALKIWHQVRGPFAAKAALWEPVLRLLLNLGAFDEADAMMQEGQKRYPNHEHFAKGYVQIAQRRGDPEETLRRCEIVRKKFPRLAEGYTVAVECLSKLGRLDEAEAMIEQGVRNCPPGLHLLVGYARQAERRRDWQQALRRWEPVRAQFDHIYGHNGIAQCLFRLGQLDEAETVATETSERFPTAPWAFAMLADIAAARGDLNEAARRWDTARRRRSSFAHAYKAGADVERRLGREDKADEILALGVTMVRGDLDLHLQYARSAHRRGDWEAAVERWALVQERFPDCDEAREAAAEATAAVHRQAAAPSAGEAERINVSEAPPSDPSRTAFATTTGS